MNSYCILFSIIFGLSFSCYSQVIKGQAIAFESTAPNIFTIVVNGEAKTFCDSLGNFTLTLDSISQSNSLEILPFPKFRKVTINNIPLEGDTIILNAIPLFRTRETSIPIVSFKSKRASKKHFKKLELERDKQEQIEIHKIRDYVFKWNGQTYKFTFSDSNSDLFISL